MFYNDDSKSSFRSHCIGTELKFVLFPKKCELTGKLLWLAYAYKQTAMWTGPGDPVFDYSWYDKDNFLLARIKGMI